MREFVEQYRVRRSGQCRRGWREISRVLGLDYSGDEPKEIKGGLAERWRNKPLADITRQDVDDIIHEAHSVVLS